MKNQWNQHDGNDKGSTWNMTFEIVVGYFTNQLYIYFPEIPCEPYDRSSRVRTPVALLHSLSDKYPWERYETPYPPSYGLNSKCTVLLGELLWH